MACAAGTTTFRIESGGTTDISANATNVDVCTATQILDRLHRDFTEQYVAAPVAPATVPAGKTQIAAGLNVNPTFYLRNQPSLTAGELPYNRFYKIFTEKTDVDADYRIVVSAIMKGVGTDLGDKGITTYKTEPTPKQTDFNNPSGFQGIYGLINVNELLEKKIADTVGRISGSSMTTNTISDTDRYEMRNGIKTTFEEIAHRENQIYREKFLNIILIIVGIFLVSTQLMQKYFSFEGGGGGFGFGGGSLFSGFGIGSGSGLFSRFGGLGLGRSGRSRIGSSLFTNNPYSLSNR
jgi:hypothetical protein